MLSTDLTEDSTDSLGGFSIDLFQTLILGVVAQEKSMIESAEAGVEESLFGNFPVGSPQLLPVLGLEVSPGAG